MKMFMIVSAKDNLKHWFPVENIVGISEEAEGTMLASLDKNFKSYSVRSRISVTNEDGGTNTYYSMEPAEDMVERLELRCMLD